MTDRQSRRTRRPPRMLVAALVAGSALAGSCALTHKKAPPTQELALQYSAAEAGDLKPVGASLKVERFSAMSPFDGTSIYFRSGGVQMESFNYYRWASTPADQVSAFLYRDFSAAQVFRAVFPYTSTERVRFHLEGTVVDFVMVEGGGSPQAHLTIDVSLIDRKAQQSDQRVVLQREFKATRTLQGDSAEQFATGMSAAMKSVSQEIVRAVAGACRSRVL